jgi:hypothetical protein
MTYKFKWKRRVFWKTYKKCIGHKYYSDMNRMDIFFENGSIKSIPNWSSCYLKLDTDWVLFTKKQMEDESGQDIKLKVTAK